MWDMFDEIGGWFVPIYIIVLLITIVLIPQLLATSPSQTEFVNFYKSGGWVPFIPCGLTIIAYFIFKTSIFPIGQYDPDRYPVQKLGYGWSFLISLGVGLLLMYGFYSIVSTTKEIFIEVPQLLVPGLQQVSNNWRDLTSGHNPTANAVFSTLLPTFYENPTFMYLPLMVVWLSIYFISFTLTGDKLISNIFGMVVGIIVTIILFALIAHAQSYQNVETAYTKAMIFTGSCLVPTALTGFPMPCDLAHMGNNWAASFFSVTRYVAVYYPVLMIFGFLMIPKNRIRIKNLLNSRVNLFKGLFSQKFINSIDSMRIKILSLMLIGLLLIPTIVQANILTDLWDKIASPLGLSTTSGFTTLSVSKVDMLSRDPQGVLSGQVYALNILAGGYGNLGQYAYAGGSTNSFQSIKADGKVSEYDVKIDVESKNQEAHYTILDKEQGAQSIMEFKLLKCGRILFPITSDSECISKITDKSYTTVFTARLSGDLLNKYVLYYVPITIGIYRMPTTPKVKTEVQVTLTRDDGKKITGIVNNYDNPWAKIGDQAIANFNGGLKLYNNPPDPYQEYLLVTSSANNKNWYIIDENYYDQWKNTVDEGFYSYYWESGLLETKTPSQIQNTLNAWNNLAKKSAQPISWENGKFVGSDYVIDLDNDIYMNNLVIYVKTDWLGIYTPTSKVSITKIEKSDFKVGNEGTVRVTVKNSGDERASTSISVSCPSFTGTTSSKTVVVDPNGEETVTLKLGSGQIKDKKCEDCVVKAETLISTALKTISVCALPSETVSPYAPSTPSYDPNEIRTCYENAESKVPLVLKPIKGLVSLPFKLPCFIMEKKTNIYVGLVLLGLAVAVSLLLFKLPIHIGLIIGGILFILTLWFLLFGTILLIGSIALMLFVIIKIFT